MTRIICIFFILFSLRLSAQESKVPYDRILGNDEIIELLDVDADAKLRRIQSDYQSGRKEKALQALTEYFKEKLSDRYFFSWKNFGQRFEMYNKMYSGRKEYHQKKAKQHLDLYPAKTHWKIPFTNLKGEQVSSYPYRHLTRQHKAGDIALLFHYTENESYLHYIPKQAESLNEAFENKQFETIEDGNGVYEAYRAGNRMYNWLFVHHCLLASEKYSWNEQLTMIKTFLHTGAKLNVHNQKYKEGNHQTRGMSALSMLAILFREFIGVDQWQQTAIARLEEHLEKEIYPDGFQFERSVHYHIDDIDNYFYPYQLAKINGIELNPIWDNRLKGMFNAMLQLAMPNKNLPVLQDDTKDPWAEVNKVGDIMALGSALFGDKNLKYFAGKKIPSKYYWLLSTEQVEKYKTAKASKPKMSSTDLPYTGYYVMRNSWKEQNLYMVISAGLSEEKPDHQHGDMLGVQAYAYGNMLLPNYQVRYYLNDLEEFKNSWTKSVAVVDSVLHGREWKGNKGGSGFGKWGKLPTPKLINWTTTDEMDIFIGSHDGYRDLNVDTYRQVFFIKDGFWIVRDHYKSKEDKHTYQQVWQGHYDAENDIHVRSVFPNGAGLEIIQLGHRPDFLRKKSARGKGRIVFEAENQKNTSFTSLLYPFKDFENRIHANSKYDDLQLAGWHFFSKPERQGIDCNCKTGLSKNGITLLFDCSQLKIQNTEILLSNPSDLLIKKNGVEWEIANCGISRIKLSIGDHAVELLSGKSVRIEL
ncbi:heparinase II/III family protein [Marinifilum caeruleilacunae]|uniref:Heparinase n=1 Tax=Marinifilum caeruleilacunae TaxID=2499076 RepID=A0ABX1WUG0_9BACT|nr:heparinase II/III family protein [Marinifilum caeruleilacunae]NOU59726.1 heparinase [Marinifilum caeruleilacunae]